MAGNADLPLAKGERHLKAFARLGWECVRRKGSHAMLKREGWDATIVIPCNKHDVKRGLLRTQLQLAGISIEDYCAAFK